MKKILCVAMALMLMAACMVTVLADETPVITVEQVAGVPGETVEVEVSVSAINMGTYGMEITYDHDVLTLVSVAQGAASQGMFAPTPDNYTAGTFTDMVSCINFSNYNAEGVLFTITFAVAENAPEGQHEVSVAIDNVTKADGVTSVDVNVVAGYVEIAHTHNYTPVVTEPTCLEGGYTTYTCSCGDSYVADETDALGHAWGEWVAGEGNACLGDVQTRTCERCGETETQSVDGAGHTWGDWVVTTEPTCGDAGVETRTCSACGETENREVPATGEHTVGDWTTVTEPTCNEKGSKMGVCSVCNMTVVEDIDALGHDFVEAYTYDETHHWHVCSRCDEISTKETHLFDELVDSKDATETEEGWKTYACVCGATSTSTVPPTGDGNAVIVAAFGALAAVAGAVYVTSKRKSF